LELGVDNRALLLEVSLDLFARYGYDAVGVQTIVETAKLTKPTLYHYFGSKRGLFEALVQEKGDLMLEIVREATIYRHDINKSVHDLVNAYFNYVAKHPVFYRMILSMWFAPPDSEYFSIVKHMLEQQLVLIEQLFVQAATDHGNMRGRHQRYALSLKGIIDTYVGLSLQGYVDLKSDHLQYQIVHQFLHGIFS
jgi:TetR/AcrR family transcriptional regulator